MEFLRKNRATLGMLVFTLLFYALLLAMHHAVDNHSAAEALKAEETLTKQELKQKEASFKENIQKAPAVAGALTILFLMIMLTGLALNIHVFNRKFQGLPVLEARVSAAPSANWGPEHVLTLIVFLFFFEAVIVLIEMIASPWVGLERFNKDVLLMANSLLRNTAVGILAIVWIRRRFGRDLRALGLTTAHFWRNVRTGILGYLFILPVLFVLLLVISWLAQTLAYEPAPQTVVQIYLKSSSDPYILYFTLFVALAGPAIEEIFFRGFTYSAFKSRWGVSRATLGSAALFALLHMNLVAFLPIFILGLFLAYLYEHTGSLVPSMTVHMLHNFIMVGLALFFKGVAA